jgi:uncharacterized glyoxalase superfamily protein PhnB
MPILDNYFFFNGNCAEAMRFCERTHRTASCTPGCCWTAAP